MNLKIVSLYADHLNLNGDQANLFVLQKRHEWRGGTVINQVVNKGQDIPADSDLIFLGHGSMAAWNDIDQDLERIAPQIFAAIASGSAFMAVATGYERAIKFGFFEGSLEKCERISKFEIVQLDENDVLGYLNAATKAPVLQKLGLLIGTQLHGPLFAKNPELADSFLAEILAGKEAETELASASSPKRFAAIDSIVESVWNLETELASE